MAMAMMVIHVVIQTQPLKLQMPKHVGPYFSPRIHRLNPTNEGNDAAQRGLSSRQSRLGSWHEAIQNGSPAGIHGPSLAKG